jgi:hypothetical protein
MISYIYTHTYIHIFPTAVTVGSQALGLGVVRRLFGKLKLQNLNGTGKLERGNAGTLEPSVELQSWVHGFSEGLSSRSAGRVWQPCQVGQCGEYLGIR